MKFVNTASLVPQTVKAYLEHEIREGGLLEDVETLHTGEFRFPGAW